MSTIAKPVVQDSSFINNFIVFLLKLEVFLIPLFFVPATFEIYEFNKQNIIWLLTFSAALLWIINSVLIEKKIVYKKTPLDIPLLIFLAVWGMSAILSIDSFSSWFGYYGRFSDAYLSTLAFGLMYFLIVHCVNKKQLTSFFKIFLTSASIVFITSLFSIFNIFAYIPGLSQFNLLQSRFFSIFAASPETVSLFAATTLVFITALYSYKAKSNQRKQGVKYLFYLLFFASLAILFFINFTASWVVLAIGLGALFGFAMYITYIDSDNATSAIEVSIGPSLIFFIISILFLFLFSGNGGLNLTQTFFQTSLPREAVLPISQSQDIVWQSLKQDPIFGAGPGMFAYTFSMFRTPEFNNHQLWQLRFDKAPVHIIELVATVGLLGVFSYLAVIGIFIFVSFIFLRNMFRTASEESYLAFAFSFLAFILFVAQLFYMVNTALQFLFWMSMSLAMVAWRFTFSKIFVQTTIDLTVFKRYDALFKSGVAFLLLIFVLFISAQVKYYSADVLYNNFRLSGERGSLEKAIKLNPNRLNYRVALAKDYVNEVSDEIAILSNPNTIAQDALTDEQKALVQTNIAKALKEAEAAGEIAPHSVIVWENLAAIYRDITSIAVGSIQPAITYFERATELEPTNPIILSELGKLYLLHNQSNEAIDTLSRAITYKPNYFAPYISLAKAYESIDQADKALVLLEDTILRQPITDLVYEAGRLYYNKEDYTKAVVRFNQVLQQNPNHANSLYSLGLSYQKQGNNDLALEQFNKVLELNPNNELIKKVISDLNNNKELPEVIVE